MASLKFIFSILFLAMVCVASTLPVQHDFADVTLCSAPICTQKDMYGDVADYQSTQGQYSISHYMSIYGYHPTTALVNPKDTKDMVLAMTPVSELSGTEWSIIALFEDTGERALFHDEEDVLNFEVNAKTVCWYDMDAVVSDPIPTAGFNEVPIFVKADGVEPLGVYQAGDPKTMEVTLASTDGDTHVFVPVEIEVDTATLIAAGDLDGSCNNIRFTTDLEGETILNHYLESGCNTGATVFWVLQPSISNGDNFLYIQTKLATGDISDPESVFMFYDTFTGVGYDTDKWESTGTGDVAQSGGDLVLENDGDGQDIIDAILPTQYDNTLYYKVTVTSSHLNGAGSIVLGSPGAAGTEGFRIIRDDWSGSNNIKFESCSETVCEETLFELADYSNPHTYEVEVEFDGYVKFYTDGGLRATHTTQVPDTSVISTYLLEMRSSTFTTYYEYIDDIVVRAVTGGTVTDTVDYTPLGDFESCGNIENLDFNGVDEWSCLYYTSLTHNQVSFFELEHRTCGEMSADSNEHVSLHSELTELNTLVYRLGYFFSLEDVDGDNDITISLNWITAEKDGITDEINLDSGVESSFTQIRIEDTCDVDTVKVGISHGNCDESTRVCTHQVGIFCDQGYFSKPMVLDFTVDPTDPFNSRTDNDLEYYDYNPNVDFSTILDNDDYVIYDIVFYEYEQDGVDFGDPEYDTDYCDDAVTCLDTINHGACMAIRATPHFDGTANAHIVCYDELTPRRLYGKKGAFRNGYTGGKENTGVYWTDVLEDYTETTYKWYEFIDYDNDLEAVSPVKFECQDCTKSSDIGLDGLFVIFGEENCVVESGTETCETTPDEQSEDDASFSLLSISNAPGGTCDTGEFWDTASTGCVSFASIVDNPVICAPYASFNVDRGTQGECVATKCVNLDVGIDNDGDGRFNEDPVDTVDNDGDGLTDEDPVDYNEIANHNDVNAQAQSWCDDTFILPDEYDVTCTVGTSEGFNEVQCPAPNDDQRCKERRETFPLGSLYYYAGDCEFLCPTDIEFENELGDTYSYSSDGTSFAAEACYGGIGFKNRADGGYPTYDIGVQMEGCLRGGYNPSDYQDILTDDYFFAEKDGAGDLRDGTSIIASGGLGSAKLYIKSPLSSFYCVYSFKQFRSFDDVVTGELKSKWSEEYNDGVKNYYVDMETILTSDFDTSSPEVAASGELLIEQIYQAGYSGADSIWLFASTANDGVPELEYDYWVFKIDVEDIANEADLYLKARKCHLADGTRYTGVSNPAALEEGLIYEALQNDAIPGGIFNGFGGGHQYQFIPGGTLGTSTTMCTDTACIVTFHDLGTPVDDNSIMYFEYDFDLCAKHPASTEISLTHVNFLNDISREWGLPVAETVVGLTRRTKSVPSTKIFGDKLQASFDKVNVTCGADEVACFEPNTACYSEDDWKFIIEQCPSHRGWTRFEDNSLLCVDNACLRVNDDDELEFYELPFRDKIITTLSEKHGVTYSGYSMVTSFESSSLNVGIVSSAADNECATGPPATWDPLEINVDLYDIYLSVPLKLDNANNLLNDYRKGHTTSLKRIMNTQYFNFTDAAIWDDDLDYSCPAGVPNIETYFTPVYVAKDFVPNLDDVRTFEDRVTFRNFADQSDKNIINLQSDMKMIDACTPNGIDFINDVFHTFHGGDVTTTPYYNDVVVFGTILDKSDGKGRLVMYPRSVDKTIILKEYTGNLDVLKLQDVTITPCKSDGEFHQCALITVTYEKSTDNQWYFELIEVKMNEFKTGNLNCDDIVSANDDDPRVNCRFYASMCPDTIEVDGSLFPIPPETGDFSATLGLCDRMLSQDCFTCTQMSNDLENKYLVQFNREVSSEWEYFDNVPYAIVPRVGDNFQTIVFNPATQSYDYPENNAMDYHLQKLSYMHNSIRICIKNKFGGWMLFGGLEVDAGRLNSFGTLTDKFSTFKWLNGLDQNCLEISEEAADRAEKISFKGGAPYFLDTEKKVNPGMETFKLDVENAYDWIQFPTVKMNVPFLKQIAQWTQLSELRINSHPEDNIDYCSFTLENVRKYDYVSGTEKGSETAPTGFDRCIQKIQYNDEGHFKLREPIPVFSSCKHDEMYDCALTLAESKGIDIYSLKGAIEQKSSISVNRFEIVTYDIEGKCFTDNGRVLNFRVPITEYLNFNDIFMWIMVIIIYRFFAFRRQFRGGFFRGIARRIGRGVTSFASAESRDIRENLGSDLRTISGQLAQTQSAIALQGLQQRAEEAVGRQTSSIPSVQDVSQRVGRRLFGMTAAERQAQAEQQQIRDEQRTQQFRQLEGGIDLDAAMASFSGGGRRVRPTRTPNVRSFGRSNRQFRESRPQVEIGAALTQQAREQQRLQQLRRQAQRDEQERKDEMDRMRLARSIESGVPQIRTGTRRGTIRRPRTPESIQQKERQRAESSLGRMFNNLDFMTGLGRGVRNILERQGQVPRRRARVPDTEGSRSFFQRIGVAPSGRTDDAAQRRVQRELSRSKRRQNLEKARAEKERQQLQKQFNVQKEVELSGRKPFPRSTQKSSALRQEERVVKRTQRALDNDRNKQKKSGTRGRRGARAKQRDR